MTRRVILTFVALITALLILAVVPLGVSLTTNENASFRYATRSAALQVSAASEEYLVDHRSAEPMNAAVAAAEREGDCAAVYDADGTLLVASACGTASDADARALMAAGLSGRRAVSAEADGWLRVAVPVGGDEQTAGVAVFARSGDPLQDRITVLWSWLVLTAVAGLAVGIFLAVRLARWVSRPLTVLGGTAASLGGGDLAVRAPTDLGPQEVRRLAATFNQMADRTETLVNSHRGWVADVSHQLRTPLTALRLRFDLLADQADEETAAELAGAQDEIARLSRLVDGLLAVARTEGQVPRPEVILVDAVAAERVTAWEPVAHERNISLSAPHPTQSAAYLGVGDLEQVLDNVLANALEAVPDGGHVGITIATPPSRVVLRVVDDGPGMGPEAKAAAFHRFANPGVQGNGLGLAIVHRLLTGNGGAVRLLDSPGGGLTVELDLPAAPPA